MNNNRIHQKFTSLKKKGQKAFIAYVTAGDPSLALTKELVLAFEKCGVDMVEIGIPFSDPMADGSTIQAASKRALDKGVTLQGIFTMVESLRRQTDIPLLFMTYFNPVFHYGVKRFIRQCRRLGVDGLIIPDLPPEEARDVRQWAKEQGIALVFFVAPTTRDERVKTNARASTGFVYYVSLTGVTGNAQAQSKAVTKNIQRIKSITSMPICAGFGISTPQQVMEIAQHADGVIVGSAIVKKIAELHHSPDLVKKAAAFVGALTKAIK